MNTVLSFDEWNELNSDLNEALWNGQPIDFFKLIHKWGHSTDDIDIAEDALKELEANDSMENWKKLIVLPYAFSNPSKVNESDNDIKMNTIYLGSPNKFVLYTKSDSGQDVKISFGTNTPTSESTKYKRDNSVSSNKRKLTYWVPSQD